MIPRNFFMIHSGNIHPRIERNIREHQQRNPEWTFHLVDQRTAGGFIATSFNKSMLRTYDSIDPAYGAARADLLRHLLIWSMGGVYLDLKSQIVRPLDEVLRPDDSYILTQWQNGKGEAHEGFGLHHDLAHVPGGEYQTYHVIAEARHPFSKAAILRIEENVKAYRPWSAVGRTGVLRTTGPIAYTQAIHPILDSAPHRMATEAELSARMSIDDYEHATVGHYSTLTKPVVRRGASHAMLSKAFNAVRKVKALAA